MKKIIALAVAGAFVAPAFAADVTISGSAAWQYRDTASSSTLSRDGDSPLVTVTGSEELPNGLTVKADMTFDLGTSNVTNDGGDNITIGGLPFGTLEVGDSSGALDAVGDYTDIAPEKGGFGADGADHGLVVTLPSMNGMTVRASMSPKDGADGAESDASGVSVAYDFAGGQVYYGTESYAGASNNDTTDQTAYGLKYASGPFYFAVEAGTKEEDVSGTTTKMTSRGVAVSYKMGDITLGAESQRNDFDGSTTSYTFDDDTDATEEIEANVVFVSYAAGGGLTLYAESYSDGKESTNSNEDQTTIGVKYAF